MNLYLVFALALGAVSGGAAASVARQPAANVLAESRVCAARRAVIRSSASLGRAGSAVSASRLAPGAPPHVDTPLTGAATPRAPDSNLE